MEPSQKPPEDQDGWRSQTAASARPDRRAGRHPMNHDTIEVVTQDQKVPMRSNAALANDSAQTSLSPDATSLQGGSTKPVSESQGLNEPASQRIGKPRLWCNGCQCEHPWPKNNRSFHVRSRRANAALRSLQRSGDIPSIDPYKREPLVDAAQNYWSSDALRMYGIVSQVLDNDAARLALFSGFLTNCEEPAAATFQLTEEMEADFLASTQHIDSATKVNLFFDLMDTQHRARFPAYYAANTGGLPRSFYQRFPILAEKDQETATNTRKEANRESVSTHGSSPKPQRPFAPR